MRDEQIEELRARLKEAQYEVEYRYNNSGHPLHNRGARSALFYVISIIAERPHNVADETQYAQDIVSNEKMFSKLLEELEQLAATKEMLLKVPKEIQNC